MAYHVNNVHHEHVHLYDHDARALYVHGVHVLCVLYDHHGERALYVLRDGHVLCVHVPCVRGGRDYCALHAHGGRSARHEPGVIINTIDNNQQ